VTKALLFSKAFTQEELEGIRDAAKDRILSGNGQLAFVSSSGAGGRSAAMLQNYSADDLLEIVIEALDIVTGVSSGSGITYLRFGGTH
jgi:hypothetical protein